MRNVEDQGASTEIEVIPVRVRPTEVDALQVELAAQDKRLKKVEASSLGD